MTTKAQIVELLKTNDKAVARALVVLNEHQTSDEQNTEQTRYLNGRGFRPCHARMGTSMAGFYTKFNRLSPKQVNYWRALMKDGKMRIEIYAGQLLAIATEKAAALKMLEPKVVVSDIGNLMEEKIAITEMLSAYQEGAMGEGPEQDAAMERMYDRLMQIDEAVEEIKRCEFKFNRDGLTA
jgi:hypothetical protein